MATGPRADLALGREEPDVGVGVAQDVCPVCAWTSGISWATNVRRWSPTRGGGARGPLVTKCP
ncbi:hypothetical protein ACWFQ8_20345 [Streptomyces sp. NPDC055254]